MRIRLVAVVLASVLIIGCGSSSDSKAAQSTATVLAEPTVPSDFRVIIEQELGFSIAIPADWEVEPQDEAFNAQSLKMLEEVAVGTSFEQQIGQVQFVFDAGLPPVFLPTVNITTEGLSRGVSAEEFTRAANSGGAELSNDHRVLRQLQVTIDGRQAGLIHTSTPLSAFSPGQSGFLEQVILLVPDGQRGWGVACGDVGPLDPETLDRCEAIVRSFRLLDR